MAAYDPSPPKPEKDTRPRFRGYNPSQVPHRPYPTPQPYTFRGPYYQPPFYPTPPLNRVRGLPMHEVDNLLPTVPFKQRPLALKFAIALLFIGVMLCLGFVFLTFRSMGYSPLLWIFNPLFITISILGIISIIFLFIPKKLGWYFGMVTAVLALPGLGIGTLIGICTIFALMWPSNRYYFHTGQYPPLQGMVQDYNSPIPYPMDHVPNKIRPHNELGSNKRIKS